VVTFVEKWRDQIACAALFLISAVLYFQTTSFDFQFTWDDGTYVVNNPHITQFTFTNIAHLFDRPYEGLYGPIQMLTYMIDYRNWGMDPFGYHLSNLLIHSANVVLAFLMLRKLTGEFTLAVFAALVFAVHPLNVENVAWIAERKTLVSAFFVLLTWLSYLHYRQAPGRPKLAYAVSLVAYLLAVFAKGTVIGLPIILVCYEWLLRDGKERRFGPVAPYFIISCLAAAATLWATLSTDVVGGDRGPPITIAFLFGLVYPTMLPVWWEYIRLLLFPVGLSAYYIPVPRVSFLDPVVLLAMAGWLYVFVELIIRASNQVRFWFLWALFFFAPTSGLVPWLVYYADRYMYLPGIGFYVLAGIGAAACYRWMAVRWPKMAALKNVLVVIAMLGVTAVYGSLTYQRSTVWRNEITLWTDTTEKTPDFSDGHLNLGAANLREGNLDAAESAYRQADELGNPLGKKGIRIVEEARRQSRLR
jgi:hypothetical protein